MDLEGIFDVYGKTRNLGHYQIYIPFLCNIKNIISDTKEIEGIRSWDSTVGYTTVTILKKDLPRIQSQYVEIEYAKKWEDLVSFFKKNIEIESKRFFQCVDPDPNGYEGVRTVIVKSKTMKIKYLTIWVTFLIPKKIINKNKDSGELFKVINRDYRTECNLEFVLTPSVDDILVDIKWRDNAVMILESGKEYVYDIFMFKDDNEVDN